MHPDSLGQTRSLESVCSSVLSAGKPLLASLSILLFLFLSVVALDATTLNKRLSAAYNGTVGTSPRYMDFEKKVMIGEQANIYPTPYATLPMGAVAGEVSGPLIDRFTSERDTTDNGPKRFEAIGGSVALEPFSLSGERLLCVAATLPLSIA